MAASEPGAIGGTRKTGARRARARDRLIDSQLRAAFPRRARPGEKFENLLLFIDDDLRETALAIERVERYLLSTHAMLEGPHVNPDDVRRLAKDASVLEYLDELNETMESLRLRMGRLASSLDR